MSGSKAGAARARKGKGQGGVDARPAPAAHAPAARGPAVAAAEPSAAAETTAREGEYVVQLPTFEGPLDLLLHLIQQHELDILDIPVSFITEKYLEYLKLMQSLTIDLASEYLVMAATLAHIKSKMLLPVVPAGQDDDGMPGEEEEDPRAELVRRLLEYQKYKVAASELAERGTLGRDVFTRGMTEAEVPKGPAPFAATSIFNLLDAFERVLKRANIQVDHEVVFDRISITDRIVELTEKLSVRRAMRFEDLLLDSVSKGGVIPRFEVVITFLAILEMCKMKLIRVHQTDPLAPIHIELATAGGAPAAAAEEDVPWAEPREGTPGATAEGGAAEAVAEGVAAEAAAEEGAAEAVAEEGAAGAEPVESPPEVTAEEVASEAVAEGAAAEAEPVESPPDITAEEVAVEAVAEGAAAEAEPVESPPDITAEEGASEAAAEEVAPEVTAAEVAAEAESVESPPEVTAEEVVAETAAEEVAPEVTAEEAEPVESPPEVTAEEVAAETAAAEGAAEAEPVESPPEVTAEESASDATAGESPPDATAEQSAADAEPEERTPGAAALQNSKGDVIDLPPAADVCAGDAPDEAPRGAEDETPRSAEALVSGAPGTGVDGSDFEGALTRDEAAGTTAAAPPDGVAMTPAAVDTVDAGSDSDGG